MPCGCAWGSDSTHCRNGRSGSTSSASIAAVCGTDNIVWQRGGRVELVRGRATITLRAGTQSVGSSPRSRAAARHVDVIVLTNDEAGLEAQKKTRYLPLDGWLVQDGDVFVRFTNPADGATPVVPVVEGYARGQHSPYHVHVREWPRTLIIREGRVVVDSTADIAGPRSTSVDPRLLAPAVSRPAGWQPTATEAIPPGHTSGWGPLGDVLDALNESLWLPRAVYPGSARTDLDLELEFAVPDGKGGLRPFRKLRLRGRPDYLSPVGLVLPGNVRSDPRVGTQLEALETLTRAVEAFPRRGAAPGRFRVHGLLGFSKVLEEPGALGVAPRRLASAAGPTAVLGGERGGVRIEGFDLGNSPLEYSADRVAPSCRAS